VKYLYGQDEAVADFVRQLVPSCRTRGFGRCKAIGVMDNDGALIAGLVYHNYDPDAEVIEISAAALPRQYWMTRETLYRMYAYPFLEVGCQMVVQRIEASDERQQRMMAAFDFMLIRVPRMLGRDKDGVLCLLTYEDWIANKFNRRLREQLSETREAAE
jgi:RimJ/RimL family protein N-acetyltransferase